MFIFDFVFYFCWYNSLSSLRSWYKDGEQLVTSIPGYIVMKDRDLRIVANEFNEGTYTCRVHRRGNVVSANSWAIRLKPERSSNSWWGPAWVNQGTVKGGKRAVVPPSAEPRPDMKTFFCFSAVVWRQSPHLSSLTHQQETWGSHSHGFAVGMIWSRSSTFAEHQESTLFLKD